MPVTRLPLPALAAVLAAAVAAGAAHAREQIRIVGSSTVFPYTQAVAEEYSDITGAARPMTASEWARCAAVPGMGASPSAARAAGPFPPPRENRWRNGALGLGFPGRPNSFCPG